jgi:hypothetical protein
MMPAPITNTGWLWRAPIDSVKLPMNAGAARLQPTLAEAHASWGDMLAMQSQPAQAIAHYRRALELRPDLESARTGLEMVTGSRR